MRRRSLDGMDDVCRECDMIDDDTPNEVTGVTDLFESTTAPDSFAQTTSTVRTSLVY